MGVHNKECEERGQYSHCLGGKGFMGSCSLVGCQR